jgi:hypothetical protein
MNHHHCHSIFYVEEKESNEKIKEVACRPLGLAELNLESRVIA